MQKISFIVISSRQILWSPQKVTLNWEILVLPDSRFQELWPWLALMILWHRKFTKECLMTRPRHLFPWYGFILPGKWFQTAFFWNSKFHRPDKPAYDREIPNGTGSKSCQAGELQQISSKKCLKKSSMIL